MTTEMTSGEVVDCADELIGAALTLKQRVRFVEGEGVDAARRRVTAAAAALSAALTNATTQEATTDA